MWQGWQPTVTRAAVLAAAQLSSYDHSKHIMKSSFGMKDGLNMHLLASLIAGVTTTLATQPIDTVKSRVMVRDPTKGNSSSWTFVKYEVSRISREEGVRGFYRGATASYLRFGPHFIIALPLWEAIRGAMGLGYT